MPDEIFLNYLGQGYFHEDYDLEAESPSALVRRFAYEEKRQYVQLMENELSEILDKELTESAAEILWLHDAQAMYDPARDGKTYLGWLREILQIVEQALRTRPAEDDDD